MKRECQEVSTYWSRLGAHFVDVFLTIGLIVNGYALRCMARFSNRKSQRRYLLRFADTYCGELNHYGMYWLKWVDVRRWPY